jgi:L-serine deaminase
MKDFIDAVKQASHAMALMSEEWSKLSVKDDEIVQELKQWGEGFRVSLDEVPYILWSVADELEGE